MIIYLNRFLRCSFPCLAIIFECFQFSIFSTSLSHLICLMYFIQGLSLVFLLIIFLSMFVLKIPLCHNMNPVIWTSLVFTYVCLHTLFWVLLCSLLDQSILFLALFGNTIFWRFPMFVSLRPQLPTFHIRREQYSKYMSLLFIVFFVILHYWTLSDALFCRRFTSLVGLCL